jgi:hypothetical protein
MSLSDNYKETFSHYAKLYGVGYRTIIRWAHDGVPLDDEAATRLSKGRPPATTLATPAVVPPSAANGPVARRKPFGGALGLSASIGRLQAAEAAAHADFLDAAADRNEALTAQKQKQWLSLSEQLRKVEQSTPAIAEQNKTAVRLDELQATLSELFTRLRQDLETLPKRCALELVGQDAIGIEQTLKREVEEVVLALFHCRYLEGGSDG